MEAPVAASFSNNIRAELPSTTVQFHEPEGGAPIALFEEDAFRQPIAARLFEPLARDLRGAVGSPVPIRALGALGQSVRRLEGRAHFDAKVRETEVKLEQAGHPHAWTVLDFVGVQESAALALTLVSFPVLLSMMPAAFALLGAALVGTLIGFPAPHWYLGFRARSRQR
ncbi:MAG: hypothetical protein QOF51_3679 [Chloroflexota bacterium]|nr:hypothetical protein [Chloroflexota bacterium]